MRRANLRIVSLFFIASACFVPVNAGLAGDDTAPVKISVDPVSQNVQVGDQVEINLTLKNADNNVAKAPKVLDVLVEFTSPSGDTQQTNVVFKPQDSSATIKLPVSESGIFSIRAEQPELLDDDAYIFGVRPPVQGALEAIGRRAEGSSATVGTAGEELTVPLERQGAVTLALERGIDLPATVTSNPSSLANSRIQLLHRPRRPLLADGIDTGTIQAYLIGDEPGAAQDIAIHLFNSQGQLIPVPLVIHAGQLFGTTELTAEQVGQVKVSFVRSVPQVNVEGPTVLEFSFRPPIVRFALRASPPSISLAERSEILVELLNADDTPIATDQDRKISLYVGDGHGDFEHKDLTVLAGRSVARTTFFPSWWGAVTIIASTPNLLTQTSTIQVTWPVLLLVLSTVGGVLGGIADFAVRRGRHWPMVFGAVTGFLLFWGAVIGLVDVIPRAIVLNPISTFAVSFLGGFAGTDVIKLFLRKIGIQA